MDSGAAFRVRSRSYPRTVRGFAAKFFPPAFPRAYQNVSPVRTFFGFRTVLRPGLKDPTNAGVFTKGLRRRKNIEF